MAEKDRDNGNDREVSPAEREARGRTMPECPRHGCPTTECGGMHEPWPPAK